MSETEDEPLHLAVLRSGVHDGEDYLRLVRALHVDLGRGLVTVDRANELVLHGMPDGLQEALDRIPAAELAPFVAEMVKVVLDGLEKGTVARDAHSPPHLVAWLRRLAPEHPLIARARALGIVIDDA